jgi:orotate phosphoribosyltransferase
MTLRRGFTIAPGEKTLIVEDVITTGGSTRDTIEAVRKAGADVVGAASIIDRSGGSADVGVSLSSLVSLRVLSVEAADCDACKLGEPVVKPGSRKAAP